MLAHFRDFDAVTDPGTIGFAQLARTFPRPVVEESLEQAGCPTYRLRELPNDMMVYFAMYMGLRRDDSTFEVMSHLLEAQKTVFGRRSDNVPTKAGISKARIRIGSAPLKAVFDKLAVPLAQDGAINCHFAGRNILALDGMLINVADTERNDKFFGRSTNQNKQPGAYPQARLVALVECGTHAIVGANIGGYFNGEVTLAKSLLGRIGAGTVLLADRLFFGWDMFNNARNTGAELVWRIKAIDKNKLKIEKELADGSSLAKYYPPDEKVEEAKKSGLDLKPVDVRVVTFTVRGVNEAVHLITTFLDDEEAPAKALAALYMQRWEIEMVFKEMKIQLNGNQAALRSNTPDLVIQELYGLMMAHYAIRSLIHEAATRAKLDPDELSFIGALNIVRRKSLSRGSFPP